MLHVLAVLMGVTLAVTLAAAEPVEIVAHRGASWDAPENTVAAWRLAWEQGADAAELDTYLTKDGKMVVLHDGSTQRTTGVDLRVAETTLAELRALDAGKWKGEQFAGEKLPSLAEMLATLPRGKRAFIEVKCGPEAMPEIYRVVRASRIKPKQLMVISFNAAVIAEAKRLRPDLRASWLVGLNAAAPQAAEDLIAEAKRIQADGLSLSATPQVLDKAFGDKVKAAGLKLYVWTVDDADLARRMIEVGAESITTDRPGWLREKLSH